MGSAVAIRLFRKGEAASHQKVLLTCAHVVRASSTDGEEGYGPLLGEFLCWRPNTGYAKPSEYKDRQSGGSPGALAATLSPIRPLAKGDVLREDRRPPMDWALLEVSERSFQDVRCALDLCAANEGERLNVVGYPGGAITWPTGTVVQNLLSEDLSPTRRAAPGTIMLDGKGDAAPGMSGGGVFNVRGELVGIHRSRNAAELAYGAVDADHIRRELFALGWQIQRSLPDDIDEIKENSNEVRKGFGSLVRVRQDPNTSDILQQALVPLKPLLQRLKADLLSMHACKQAHEVLLHRAALKIQQCLVAIEEWKKDPRDRKKSFGVSKAIDQLQADARQFQEYAYKCRDAFPQAMRDARDFHSALKEVRESIAACTQDADQPIRQVIEQIIRTTPALLQEKLSDLASKLPFTKIAQVVEDSRLLQKADGLDGLMELVPLQSNSRRLVEEHRAWQELDKLLRSMQPTVDALLEGKDEKVRDIAYNAKRLGKRVQELQQQENVFQGIGSMLQLSSELGSVSQADSPNIDVVLNTFLELQSTADELFRKADDRLLDACMRLTEIIAPLDKLLAIRW